METYKGFKLDYCDLCERTVLFCYKCGMNECSAGYGTLPNGETCDVCPKMYEIADEYYSQMPMPNYLEYLKDADCDHKED